MKKFKQYRRKNMTEMRVITNEEVAAGKDALLKAGVFISLEDIGTGSPKIGDMIVRNPDDHEAQWLVAKAYFEKNFEEIV